jgi:pimeloyl-ACP methyl ester carboxylesterase
VNALAIDRGGESALLSCGDTNGDSMLDGADGGRFAGVSVPLNPGGACLAPEAHRDYFAGGPTDYVTFSCDAARRPLLIVAIGGGGTELLDPLSGESFALVKIVNALQGATSVRGISSVPVLMTAAVFGADLPQMRMEQWLAADLVRKLDAMPCLRVLLIGHSHGGVTVSAVTAALDAPYGDRLYGILLDRTLALYDHVTHEFPARTRILNVFQTNEGWHGVPLARANILDVDASAEVAPLGPKRGGDVLATVDHTSLDDAAAVHRIIVGWTLTVLGND